MKQREGSEDRAIRLDELPDESLRAVPARREIKSLRRDEGAAPRQRGSNEA